MKNPLIHILNILAHLKLINHTWLQQLPRPEKKSDKCPENKMIQDTETVTLSTKIDKWVKRD